MPYGVYVLNSSTVKWGDWLRISFTFHWTYNGTVFLTNFAGELNVHPADIAGLTVSFPYLGADGLVNIKDLTTVTGHWTALVPWTGTFDPTDPLHRADVNGDDLVNIKDLTIVTGH